MPGLWGLIHRDGSEDLKLLAQLMGERMTYHPSYRVEQYASVDHRLHLGRVSLGFVNSASQPATNEDGSLLAMMEGELLDYEDQRRTLSGFGHAFQGESHAEILLHGYEQQGRDFFRGLRGTFVAAIWDQPRRRIVLVNDRFGMKPLYYTRIPDGLAFASEIKALLAYPAVSSDLDPRGIAQFFTFGHLLNEETLYHAIKVLPAAGWLEHETETGRLTLDRTWRLEVGQGGGALSGIEAIDQVDAAFGRAVERCVSGGRRLGLSLSGGMDSRAVLGAINTKQTPITTVSLGMPGSIDTLSAERMARVAGCEHHRYQLDQGFLSRFEVHLRRMVHLTDGQYLDQCIVMPTLPLYRELGIEVLLRGHAGELMHMNKAYNYSLDHAALGLRNETDLEAWLWGHLRAYMVEAVDGPLFQGDLERDRESLARDSLREGYSESAGLDPPAHRIWHHFLTQRLRRETALSMVEFHSVVETRLPFLDHDLIDLIFRMPPDLKVGETLQAAILRRRRPEFLAIPNANTGTRVGAGRLARSASKFRMKVLAKLGAPGYQPYERLGLWLRRELRPVVEHILLSDRCRDRAIFNPDTVTSVVGQHMAGQRNHTYLLMALMIFEVGQRQFLDNETDEAPGSSHLEAIDCFKVS
ncbi:asparagine synthetase B family protein [Tautonia rosea]|uniref:asparagine synthetase B family protein n=1 Tax=Tautonia rosea TaxID=2728037 RepID=UPI0014765591|nr:asparagine synthase-related protein [Tautonia rosea]